MKLRQLLSWRFSLIFFHRWLGFCIGLMFVIWSLSGIILIYFGIPHFTASERLTQLPELDLSTVTISPQQAAEIHTDGNLLRLRISMLDGRPVYRINTGFVFGRWAIVYADTGELMPPFDQQRALDWLGENYPKHASNLRYEAFNEKADLFTHSPALQTFMPLHRIALGDENDSKYYVSEESGEIVMKTTTYSRLLGFTGYNLHTLFFLRQQNWQPSLLHWLGWSGLVLAILGLTLGIWRFSLKPIFINRGLSYRTPYGGWWKWHHYAGLIFGFFMLSWIFSGLVSMGEITGIKETTYTPQQIQAGARTVQGQGPYLNFSALTIEGMKNALNEIQDEFTPKELELLFFNDSPYYYAYRPPTVYEQENWIARSAFDFLTPTLEQEHLIIAANDLSAQAFTHFTEAALLESAKTAMPTDKVIESQWLTEFDNYYYNTLTSFDLGLPRTPRTLPALRVKFDDVNSTWLYMPAAHPQMIKAEKVDRLNRWGYYGLHGFDYAFLYNKRPLWDILVIVLLLGCATLSMTSIVPMAKRLKRHAKRIFK